MFEKEAEEFADRTRITDNISFPDESIVEVQDYEGNIIDIRERIEKTFKDGAEFGYNKANEWHSPDEHIDKDMVVLGIIKLCNKLRYSLVQWNGEWWYQYGTYNAEVRLIAWCNIPELPKEIE